MQNAAFHKLKGGILHIVWLLWEEWESWEE